MLGESLGFTKERAQQLAGLAQLIAYWLHKRRNYFALLLFQRYFLLRMKVPMKIDQHALLFKYALTVSLET